MTMPPPDELPLFRLVSVERASPPAGASGRDWHRYVIAEGDNTMAGLRQGSSVSVRAAAEDIVAQANERRQRQRSRRPAPASPRKPAANKRPPG
jgi:hypothetical protein